MSQHRSDGQASNRTLEDGQDESILDESSRSAILHSGEIRDWIYENHPVVRNALRIATIPLQEAYDVVEQVIVHRDPGTCLIADSRIGKTTAINKIARELTHTFPNLPVGVLNAKGHDKTTERTFFGDLLYDFQSAGALSGTAPDRRKRLLMLLLTQANSLGSDRYLLLVDEGQNWGAQELTWLRDVSNDMLSHNVTLITVMFGHTQLHTVRAELLADKRTDLVGRFLLTPRVFRGLRNMAELQNAMEAFDDSDEYAYPIKSSISSAEFFMPQAYAHGWRLGQESNRLWSAFDTAATRATRDGANIGMQWVAGAIRNFLFSQGQNDHPSFHGDDVTWLECVDASGYEASLV